MSAGIPAMVTSSASGTAPSRRSGAVYGIRGLAALALMTVHVAMFSGLLGTRAFGTPRPPSNFLGAFFVSGLPSFIGVFFVLPAMFLYLPLAKAIISGAPRPPQRNTIIRRLARLLPGYYVMCLVTMVLLNRGNIDSVWYVLRPFLLLQVYFPSPFAPTFMNGMEITWTVPSMVQWYLALPLIAWATHRYAARGATPAARARRLMLPVPFLIAIGVGWLFFVKAQGWDNRILFWWPQGFAPTVGVGLALAVMLALAQVSPQDTPKLLRAAAARPSWFLLGAFGVYLVNCARPFSVIGMDAIYTVPGLLLTYLLVALFGLLAVLPLISPGARSGIVELTLANRPAAFLGRISYGIYLWHFAVMHFYLQSDLLHGQVKPIREFYGTVGFVKLELVTFAGTVLLATVSYFLIERPAAALVDRWLARPGRRKTALASLPAARGGVPTLLGSNDAAGAATAQVRRERDAIRANLVELDRALSAPPPLGTALAGQTGRRWESAIAEMGRLWDLFAVYSTVVDDVIRTLDAHRRPSPADLARASALLTGASVEIHEEPPPLGERHVTDDGRRAYPLAAAAERMNEMFRRIGELVRVVETIRREVGDELAALDAAVAQARTAASDPPDGAGAAAVLAAEAELRRVRAALDRDPLTLRQDGQVATAQLADLRRRLVSAGRPPTVPDSEGEFDDDHR